MDNPRIVIDNLSGGVQRKTLPSIALNHQVRHCLNGDFDDMIGAIVGRKGILRQSVVVASDLILNIFVSKIGTARKYLAVSDDSTGPKVDVYKNGSANFGGTWSKSLEDWTTDVPIYFRNFIGKLFAFNGTDAPKSTPDHTTWSAVTNAPAGGKYPEVFQQRLYALSESSILHYSDTANATGDDFDSTAWENIQINPQDGQQARGLVRHRNRLVVFKQDSIYRYDGSNVAGNIKDIGTHSEKGIVKHGDLFFHHPTGIYKMGGGEPINISRPIEKYLSGMSSSNYSKVAAGRDIENVYFWIGDVTINDEKDFDYNTTYSDVVLKFNVYSENWSVYNNWNARVFYFNTDDNLLHFGTSAGKIFKTDIGTADVDDSTTTPIDFQVVFKSFDFGFPELEKEIYGICGIGDYDWQLSAGGNYIESNEPENSCRSEKEDLNEPRDIEGVARIKKTIRARELWVKIDQAYVEAPPVVRGLVFDNIKLLGYGK